MVDNMEWFNVFGLIFIAVIMIPNVVFAIKCKDGFDNKWNNKYVEITEQVGRLGCFGFMIINIPGTCFGGWSDEAFALYLIVDTILVIRFPVRMILWICMKSLIRDAVSFFSFLVKKVVVICKNLSKSVLYFNLLTSGKLYEHLAEIDTSARDMAEYLIKEMAKKQGVTEELKATDMMRWIGLMNNIRACADEIVMNDIVYS